MPYQNAAKELLAYKAQSGLGVPATGSGGFGFRDAEGSGSFTPAKGSIRNREIRRDGQRSRPRHGTRNWSASRSTQLAVGDQDTLLEALLRGTWANSIAITQAAMTSITTTTNTIVAAAGSWITQGVRRGGMVQLTGHAQAANNGKWFRVVDVTASTITVPNNSLVLDAVADTTFTLTYARSLLNGDPPVERYFTFDRHLLDLDLSYVFTDGKVVSLELLKEPDETIMCTFGFMGRNFSKVTGASAPSLTSPTFKTSIPLVMADGTIRINGVDYADISSLRLSLQAPASAPPVLALTTPDIFLGNMEVSGSVTGLKQDSVLFDAFDAETQIDIHVVAREPEAEPWDFVSFYFGNAVLNGSEFSPAPEGPTFETFPIGFGKDEAGGGRALTTVLVSTSAV